MKKSRLIVISCLIALGTGNLTRAETIDIDPNHHGKICILGLAEKPIPSLKLNWGMWQASLPDYDLQNSNFSHSQLLALEFNTYGFNPPSLSIEGLKNLKLTHDSCEASNRYQVIFTGDWNWKS
ncbi:hypothetical protein Sta7437_4821 (plasmid) [Stanieria cyanosphaera PCC 7437]|uniref:Uncharacterized protein n=1 Tax=Stanieria cyanosphaera (strain ATCC 29371 / PCC 7437) TaxID=111780 RepID=K9Y097_STAC7|nr:hypothetical protein [Stanieria cyanosphaera]AFZ38255.1 hypothetical protein Sta7437_4821 [Stanieria cyanosphaera PCC 7437]